MAKYQKYAEYKDSGVEWLGEIPSDWSILKLKFAVELISEKSQEVNQKYVGMENIASKNGKYIQTEEVIPEGISNTFKVSDVLFGKLRPYLAKSWLADFCGICSSELLVLRAKKIAPKFLQYYTLTDEFVNQVDSSTYGSKMPRASWDFIGLLPIPISSFELSTKIANFLDHETAKIDTLITKQEKLIELLKEKRQAVISHAVTKGLNPNVKMKNSGVEWLGEVPEHWISARLKYYTNQIVDGAHFTPTYSESGVPFLRVTDIHNEEIDMEDIKYIPENEHRDLVQRCKPEKGDLLLSKNGTIGVPKLINWDWQFSIFVSLCLIKFKKNLKAEFAEYFFKSYEIQEQIFGLIKKSTVINLHLDKIQNFWFSIPPVEEQSQIIYYLDKKIAELNKLIGKAESAIQLMQERRTALISAAVTGKIDVRNWKNPNQKNEAKMELSA